MTGSAHCSRAVYVSGCRLIEGEIENLLQMLCRATFPHVHNSIGIESFLSFAWPVGPVFCHWTIIQKLTGEWNGILHQGMPANGQYEQDEVEDLHGNLLDIPQNCELTVVAALADICEGR
jgi:hypothetical protein